MGYCSAGLVFSQQATAHSLSDLWGTITLVFQNIQTHRFTLTTLSTWRENQLLWHFISLFAVAIETGFAGEDCVRACVCVCFQYWCHLSH